MLCLHFIVPLLQLHLCYLPFDGQQEVRAKLQLPEKRLGDSRWKSRHVPNSHFTSTPLLEKAKRRAWVLEGVTRTRDKDEIEAACQRVYGVVFTQVGALAHSGLASAPNLVR